MYRFGFLEVAMRQNDLAIEVKDYLKSHPKESVGSDVMILFQQKLRIKNLSYDFFTYKIELGTATSAVYPQSQGSLVC